MANISQTLRRGKVFHADPYLDYTDNTNNSDWTAGSLIDTTNLHVLTVHIYGNQSTAFSYGSFALRGTNFSDVYFGNSPLVTLQIDKTDGDGTFGPTAVTLPTTGNFSTLLTYTKLPRFVYPTLSLSGASSMVGRLWVGIHGWEI